MSHEVSTKTYFPSDLADLRCLDYAEQYLFELSYGDVGVAKEPESHKFRLEEDIRQKGVMMPILTLRRKNEQERLIEGHHRSILAYYYNLSVPVELHNCDCPVSSLDDFGLCDEVRAACKVQRAMARDAGWEWQK